MAKKRPLTWVVRPTRPKKPAIPAALKAQANAKAEELVLGW
jgi:hypothetical protein